MLVLLLILLLGTLLLLRNKGEYGLLVLAHLLLLLLLPLLLWLLVEHVLAWKQPRRHGVREASKRRWQKRRQKPSPRWRWEAPSSKVRVAGGTRA